MARLMLMRHGETDYNRQGRYQGSVDIELNAAGIFQAEQAAKNLCGNEIDLIISSPLKRALATAEIAAAAIAVEVQILKQFSERSMGAFEGMSREEIDKQYPECGGWSVTHQFFAAPPNGESLFEFSFRIATGLDLLRSEYAGKNILLVCHGGVARSIHGILCKLSNEQVFGYNLQNCAIDNHEW